MSILVLKWIIGLILLFLLVFEYKFLKKRKKEKFNELRFLALYMLQAMIVVIGGFSIYFYVFVKSMSLEPAVFKAVKTDIVNINEDNMDLNITYVDGNKTKSIVINKYAKNIVHDLNGPQKEYIEYDKCIKPGEKYLYINEEKDEVSNKGPRKECMVKQKNIKIHLR